MDHGNQYQEMEYNSSPSRQQRWSTAVNPGTKIPLTKMESTNSDDGGYDVDEVGIEGVMGGGYGKEVQLYGGTKRGEEEAGAATTDGSMEDVVAAGGGGFDHDNMMMMMHEADAHDDVSRDESDVSSADKYSGRNSDPGVHVTESASYSLPYMPPNHAVSMGGIPTSMNPNAPMNNPPHSGSVGNNLYPNMHHHHQQQHGPPLPSGAESVSLGTATQTHEVRMPMLLSTFKPATGCTNASDFVVRCFVARLRSGITVVKHGRSRWCKSRLRILHVHPDGRSLSWKPALGEPSSGKRPPKLDLTTCKEVRHAWSPDPDNPMFTGTPILRQKCEAANAHKSFALIFPKRTVDITAVTADQCKVLMEGFSALCFRLQVAQSVAGGEGGKDGGEGKKEDDDDRGTASVTLTNTSAPQNSPKKSGGRKRNFR